MSYQKVREQAGIDQSKVKKQFRINPMLQRTQATGNRQGKTVVTSSINIVSGGVVRLPNRAVPLNPNQPDKRRAGRQPR